VVLARAWTRDLWASGTIFDRRPCRDGVGLSGKGSPDQLYGGQSQLGEEQLDAGRVAGISRSHAAPTVAHFRASGYRPSTTAFVPRTWRKA
jgi:hypothetical protein